MRRSSSFLRLVRFSSTCARSENRAARERRLDGILSSPSVAPGLARTLRRSLEGARVDSVEQVLHLLSASSDEDRHALSLAADLLREEQCGDRVSYVVNRNINFTNVCVKRCGFCAFSRSARSTKAEGYVLPVDEIVARALSAKQLGATEVCIQAGLLPKMDAALYVNIVKSIKDNAPDLHIHAFSPEEVLYGAKLNKSTIREFLLELRHAGLGSLPGTSAEILDQPLRNRISPGRIPVSKWVEVVRTAHELGIATTSTMMYGHVESKEHVAAHLLLLQSTQRETRGFTEFVPLSFVHTEAPMFLASVASSEEGSGVQAGPSEKERLVVHAAARVVLGADIRNIQVSWVKEGCEGAQAILQAGANDIGGTLMNESISTAAGSKHGQFMRPSELRELVRGVRRVPVQRTTLYETVREYKMDQDETQQADTQSFAALESAQTGSFGTFHDMIKDERFAYRTALKPAPSGH